MDSEAIMDLRIILCPVDFSEASSHAVGYATALARTSGAKIVGLHVEEPAVMAAGAARAVTVGAEVRPDAAVLQRIQRQFGAPSPQIVADLAPGEPADAIARYARVGGADLVVMGTRGASGIRHFLLGSVTEEVIRRSPVPVLAVPPHAAPAPSLPFRNVLVATDFSAASLAALRAAIQLGADDTARFTILHVIDEPDENELFVARPYDVHQHAAERESSVRESLGEIVHGIFKGRRAPCVSVVRGQAPHEILASAENVGADLLVLGVHGGNPIDSALFGSTTNQVVRRATCPVLTARCWGQPH
jgi:nucleotide-binding universal stress UspA family protein